MNEELAAAKILPLLIRLTIPATAAQLVNALYSIVDRMYIGHMPGDGTLALSAIGLTYPITMLVAALSCLPGMGGAPLASIALGKGEVGRAQKYLCNALTMLLTISVIMTAGCLIFLKPLLILFGADHSTLPYASQYLTIYLLGTVFVELSLGLNPFINTQGYTFIGTMSVVIGAIINIVLDPILIYVLHMGVRGAAIATVTAQFVSCVWILHFLSSPRSSIRLCAEDMRPDKEILCTTCALGISPCTFRVNESVVVILLNRLLIIYGGAEANLHLASMAILSSISQVLFMPLIGIVTGAQPLLSYNLGAKNYPRLRETIRYARILSMSCATLTWAILMFWPELVSMLFTRNPELTVLTKLSMRIMFSTFFVIGMQMINQNAFVAMGNTRYSFLFGIMRKLLFLVPLALVLPHFIGVWGIYAAEAVSNPLTAVITYVVFECYMHQLKNQLA
ncbi:MAG: MATE family efflux transporter [Oribacterium sp.]|nr:MATE family efflux transporter [Oribacterium sp.]